MSLFIVEQTTQLIVMWVALTLCFMGLLLNMRLVFFSSCFAGSLF